MSKYRPVHRMGFSVGPRLCTRWDAAEVEQCEIVLSVVNGVARHHVLRALDALRLSVEDSREPSCSVAARANFAARLGKK